MCVFRRKRDILLIKLLPECYRNIKERLNLGYAIFPMKQYVVEKLSFYLNFFIEMRKNFFKQQRFEKRVHLRSQHKSRRVRKSRNWQNI